MTNTVCGEPRSDGDPCQWDVDAKGPCPFHGDGDSPDNGRPTKLEDTKEDILDAAREGLTLEGIARVAGIGVSTLREWRTENDDFSAALRRARAEAERELIQDVDPEFVLERSYGYMKTEKREITGEDGGGLTLNLND
jgi:hypothetical protein